MLWFVLLARRSALLSDVCIDAALQKLDIYVDTSLMYLDRPFEASVHVCVIWYRWSAGHVTETLTASLLLALRDFELQPQLNSHFSFKHPNIILRVCQCIVQLTRVKSALIRIFHHSMIILSNPPCSNAAPADFCATLGHRNPSAYAARLTCQFSPSAIMREWYDPQPRPSLGYESSSAALGALKSSGRWLFVTDLRVPTRGLVLDAQVLIWLRHILLDTSHVIMSAGE